MAILRPRKLHEIFTKYARTHNTAVFDAYTPGDEKMARHSHIVTGLPDTYGRGRIVGDYRRVALYGIDYLIKEKQNDFANCGDGTMTDDVIRLREEIALQIRALNDMKAMAAAYGYDISLPAANAKEAVQWAVLWLSGCHQDPERRCHERWPYLHPSWISTSSATWIRAS